MPPVTLLRQGASLRHRAGPYQPKIFAPLLTNYATDPRNIGTSTVAGTVGTFSNVTDYPVLTTAVRHTRSAGTTGRIDFTLDAGFTFSTSKTYTFVMSIRSSVLITGASFNYRITNSSGTGQVTAVTQNIQSGLNTVTATAAGCNGGRSLALIWTAATANTLDIARLTVVEGTWAGGHRDGTSTGWAWNGTADASTSSGRV